MKEDKYIMIIIILLFAIGISFMIGHQIGWESGFKVAKVLMSK